MGNFDIFKIASEFDLASPIYSKDLTYLPVPNDGFLVTPSSDPTFMQKSIPIVRKTSKFSILQQENVALFGQRSFATSDGFFFTDESQNKEYSFEKYCGYFIEPNKVEDFTAEFMAGEIRVAHNAEPVITVDDPVVCLNSAEPSNYGSWLYRVIPKIISLDRVNERKILAYQNSPWMRKFIEFFIGPKYTAIPHWPHRRYLLRDAIIPTARNIDVYFDDESLKFYRTSASAIIDKSPYSKIYFSRLGQSIRPLTNEYELIKVLQDAGFYIADPAKLTFEEQIALVRDASVIVCPGGSGLFNAVFASNAKLIIDIEPGWDWIYAHHNLMRSCRIPHIVVRGQRAVVSDPHSAWTVSVSHVLYALRC